MTQSTHRHCTVYQGRGEQALVVNDSMADGLLPPQEKTQLHHVMCRDLVCAHGDLEVSAVTNLMLRHHIGCIPIVDDHRVPIGMITEREVVELVEAWMSFVGAGFGLPPEIATRRADRVMGSIALALDEYTDISHAAAMMLAEETHHVLAVARNGALVGVVSAKDIVAWYVESESSARPRKSPAVSTWRPLEG